MVATLPRCIVALVVAVLTLLTVPATGAGQAVVVRGTVLRHGDGVPVERAQVSVVGTAAVAVTGPTGRFVLHEVPVGAHVLRVVRVGYLPREERIVVASGVQPELALTLEETTVSLAELIVTAVSRLPERLVAAPGAVTQLDPASARDLAISGQPALALATLPGVNLVQSDVQDFNVNARGFNTSFNRRVLVLQDGRDLAIAFTGSQEWLALGATIEDMAKVEFVRGPSAALYGANAFSGVLNLTTPAARETIGSRLSVGGGDRSTLRADARHAGVFGGGRWGYRLAGGYQRNEAWAMSRTDPGDLAREYSVATDSAVVHPFPGFELRPLNGQDKAEPPGVPGPATGTPDPVIGAYGSGRLDYYATGGAVLTVEGGQSVTRNATLIGSAARFQISRSLRPWARVAWADERFHVMAYYSGRDGDAQQNLAAGTESLDRSHLLHLEAQGNRHFAADRGRLVLGGSVRRSAVNTEGTLLDPRFDDRADHFTSGYAQVEYDVHPSVHVVVAGRFDASSLYHDQFSPKAAVVFTPTSAHAFRASVGRAFQMPNTLDYFVALPAGPPADFTAIESALRASPLAGALDGVPVGALFTTSDAVPLLALGNPDLDVEHVTSWELGYKGTWGRVFVEVAGYYSRMNRFVTDVLPGVNPRYAPWTAPDAVPAADRDAVVAAVRQLLTDAGQGLAASALTRLEDGRTAMVLSIGNAGRATVRGVELEATWQATPELTLHGNLALFGFHLEPGSFVAGDVVLPNTPERTGNVVLSYRGRGGLDLGASVHLTSAHAWAAGTFVGPVPSTETVNATASQALGPGVRIQVAITNLLDQRRYHQFGGTVIGRRILGGMQFRF